MSVTCTLLTCVPCATLPSSSPQTWAGQPGNWDAAQSILVALAKANSEAQRGQFKGPHPVPGGGRIIQALRTGGAGK
jgi:fructose-bisphosphate aldolase class I